MDTSTPKKQAEVFVEIYDGPKRQATVEPSRPS